MFQLQGRYSQIPAFNHNSFALGFHRSSPDLNIQQLNYTSIPMNLPHPAHQPFTVNQSMLMSGMASYQQNSLFSHGPSPSQTYPVPYSGGLSSSVISGFQRLYQQTGYHGTVTPGASSMSAFIPEASAGQLRSSSESCTDASSHSCESAYIVFMLYCFYMVSLSL